MVNMNNLTVIIPVHKFDDNIERLLKTAVNSVPQDIPIIIVANTSAAEDLLYTTTEANNISVLSSESTTFCGLVNAAVEKVDTQWFSILEFDDVYTKIWFNEVEKHIKYKPNVSVFMPLTDLMDFEDSKFIGYGNESVWASSFSNELGYVDYDCLQNFFDFYLTGSVFNKDDWKAIGGLKNSIKLTFWYEFLLRATHNNKKIFVIPRVGYVHYLNREGSLIKEYSSTIDEKESEGWISIAKKEHFFNKDRGKVYEKEEGD